MAGLRKSSLTLSLALCLLATQIPSFAFSLLGPLAPWMTPGLGYIQDPAFDVGGPRNLGDEFRWNIPIITYGFDPSFTNFFGTNGIAAVEGAIAGLNALPSASEIDLSRAPTGVDRFQPSAQNQNLLDLRSAAFVYLLEQIGLAESPRFTWLINTTNAPLGAGRDLWPADYILQRNFDPITLLATYDVNSVRYSFEIREYNSTFYPIYPPSNRILNIFPVDLSEAGRHFPISSLRSGIFQQDFMAGRYIGGRPTLTRDDLGGLIYLYSKSNINIEPCLPGVRSADGTQSFVNIAARPGVEKITLQRFDPGSLAITNIFTDTYLENGELRTQQLARVVDKPDLLFTAENHPAEFGIPPAMIRRTGPNFSHAAETGSGLLLPGVVISFHKFGDISKEVWYSYDSYIEEPRWSNFDSRTPIIQVIYPVGPDYQGARTLSLRPLNLAEKPALEWQMRLIADVEYAIESSTNLINWNPTTNIVALPIHTITNTVSANGAPTFWRARRISSQ